MTREDEPEGRSVDRLDVAPASPGRAVWLIGLVAGLAVLLAVTIGVNVEGSGSAPVPPESPSPVPDVAGDEAPAPAPVMLREGPALVDGVESGFVVYARSEAAVFRIEPGSGVVTETPDPGQGSGGRQALVASRGSVIAIRGDGSNLRRLYRDDRPGERLGGIFSQANQILPGPEGSYWIVRGAGWQSVTVTQVGADGEELGSLDVLGTLSPAGDGELLMEYLGRTWRIGSDLSPVKISDGVVRGVGESALLVGQCDDDLVCHQSVTDRDGEEIRRLQEGPLPRVTATAEISPDGRWMVETVVNENGDIGGRLVDLVSGAPVRELPSISPSSYTSSGTATGWLPASDGYLLLAGGRLTLLDPETGGMTALALDLPPLLTMTTAG